MSTRKKSKKLLVRMYDVGFGDCFLIIIPGEPKRSILVDAGFHSQGKGSFAGNELAEQLVSDLAELVGAPRIDVVIATHRHQDHVFTFNSRVWDEVEVGEVWLPWLEDPHDDEAVTLWKKGHSFAHSLALARKTLAPSKAKEEELRFLLWNAGVSNEALGMAPLAGPMAAWSNAGALERLRTGFARRDRQEPRYLPHSHTWPETFETDVLPGVRVHVLGPPRDPELIDELDPTADGETYRAIALAAAGGAAEASAPFGETWCLPELSPGSGAPPLTDQERARLESLATGVDGLLAAQSLDHMVNSTSLLLVLQIGRARLLLPGDAEWGTWKRVLADDDARALLAGTTFLKVGHHGSHNATPKTLVEEVLPEKVAAMISTQEGKGNFRNDIPLPDLIDALEARSISVVRSDDHDTDLPKGHKREENGRWIDLELAM